MIFPRTRKEALRRLAAFLPEATTYARDRNSVLPGHANVSQLSAALRTRVVLETEVADACNDASEKFVQEVYWRLYWKGWLEMRPSVWTHYCNSLASFTDADREKAIPTEQGESRVAIMDRFARELVETGYLHNHARMWFAAFWIHDQKLPWELGADFFMRHLNDADAASNTLSWRWVAGLHTPGKTYLARRSNIEKYCHPEILSANAKGLERLEAPEPALVRGCANPEILPFPEAPLHLDELQKTGRWGLWLHDEDLLPENSILTNTHPTAIHVAGDSRHAAALVDCQARATEHFRVTATRGELSDLPNWVKEQQLDTVVSFKPFVGPLSDRLEEIRPDLPCELRLFRREEDTGIMRLATAGFFSFWKKVQRLENAPISQDR